MLRKAAGSDRQNRQARIFDTAQHKKTKTNPVINPESNENRFRPQHKPPPIANRQFKFQPNTTKRQNQQATGINRFKLPSQEAVPKVVAATKTKRVFISRPAPSSQFKKYLSDTQNVFYEDSADFKNLRRIKTAKFYLTMLVLLMSLSYIAVGRIVPYPKERCPKHAVCNVFIHCHKGYALQGDICVIDPLIINKAKEISQAVVSQLQYNYGERDCCSEDDSLPISTKIQDIFYEFKVEDEMLMNEIIYFFLDKDNQLNYQFSYKFNNIVALAKMHSLSCSASLFIRSSNFKYNLLAFTLIVLGAVKLIKMYVQSKKIHHIYTFLKRKTLIEGELCINEVKQEAERRFGAWTSDRWMKVDLVRSSDGCIAYYIDEDEVIWKKID